MKIRFTAETPYERAKGLMFSRPLDQNEIAVFKFDSDSTSGFWNKNVNYPINVYFFDKGFNLVGISSLEANQEELVKALKPYRYVVETQQKDNTVNEIIEIQNYLRKKYEL